MTAGLLRRLSDLAAERAPALRAREVRLTSRESEIAELLDEGLSNKEIAQRLSISLSTVKNHVHSILDKLQVTRRGEAVALLRGRDSPDTTSERSSGHTQIDLRMDPS
jgi:DNA-binding NarL/FixJ family response regulator